MVIDIVNFATDVCNSSVQFPFGSLILLDGWLQLKGGILSRKIKTPQNKSEKWFRETRTTKKAYYQSETNSEHQRAENAESQVREMLGIPEIKEIWESIQQNKEAFSKQIDKWIEESVAAIKDYADGKDNDSQAEQGNAVAWGIIVEAFRYGLDPTDKKQNKMAAAYLLEKVSWMGITDSKANLTALRTQQLCDAMMVIKDLMANLLLAAGGRCSISIGGGGSTSELTNWDGTKKNTGWGI